MQCFLRRHDEADKHSRTAKGVQRFRFLLRRMLSIPGENEDIRLQQLNLIVGRLELLGNNDRNR